MRARIALPVTGNTTREIALPAPLDTTTAIAIMGVLTSDLAPGVHLPTGTVVVTEGTGIRGANGMLTAPAGVVQASRLIKPGTVHKLLSKYGMTPHPSGPLRLEPNLFPKKLLNLIKVLRMSAWLKAPRICI